MGAGAMEIKGESVRACEAVGNSRGWENSRDQARNQGLEKNLGWENSRDRARNRDSGRGRDRRSNRAGAIVVLSMALLI